MERFRPRSVSRMNVKGFFVDGGNHHTAGGGLLIIGQGTIQTVHGDNPITGNGKQIRAGIADGNTGLTTVHHWHHGGGPAYRLRPSRCRKKTGCRILLPYYFFSSSVSPKLSSQVTPVFPLQNKDVMFDISERF